MNVEYQREYPKQSSSISRTAVASLSYQSNTQARTHTCTHWGNTDESMRYFKSKGLMFDIYVRRDKNGTTQIPINGRERGRPSKSDQNTREGVERQSTPPPLAPTRIWQCVYYLWVLLLEGGEGGDHFSSHKISHNMTGQIIIIIIISSSSSRNRTHTFAYFITLTNWIISGKYLTPSSAPFKMIDHVKFQ